MSDYIWLTWRTNGGEARVSVTEAQHTDPSGTLVHAMWHGGCKEQAAERRCCVWPRPWGRRDSHTPHPCILALAWEHRNPCGTPSHDLCTITRDPWLGKTTTTLNIPTKQLRQRISYSSTQSIHHGQGSDKYSRDPLGTGSSEAGESWELWGGEGHPRWNRQSLQRLSDMKKHSLFVYPEVVQDARVKRRPRMTGWQLPELSRCSCKLG